MRRIESTLDEPQRTGHGERHRLLTSLLDAEKYPAHERIGDDHERWDIERVFDDTSSGLNGVV